MKRLAFLDRLRATGMSLSDIASYTSFVRSGRGGIKHQRAMLCEHRDKVRENIVSWQDALKMINDKIAIYDEWIASGVKPGRRQARSRSARTRAQ